MHLDVVPYSLWLDPLKYSTLNAEETSGVSVSVSVLLSHIQRIGCQSGKTTLHGDRSRSWSAEQGK